MALMEFLKNQLRPVKRAVLRPIDFPRSLQALRELEKQLYAGGASPVDVPAKFDGFGEFRKIRPAQIRSEIQGLFEIVRDLKPKVVVEIGTALGGTFYIWCQAAAEDALLVSLDLPHTFYSPNRRDFYGRFARAGQTTKFLPGDSHLPQALEALKAALGGREIDFLFIDGDHSDKGVRQDFDTFSPLVRKGGVIAFHDILPNPVTPRNQVYPLWRELKTRYPRHREIIETDKAKDTNANMVGIGVIWV